MEYALTATGDAAAPMKARRRLWAASQMSRKRPANAVTCGVLLSQVVDLHEFPFGCFTLVLADAVGSPRKVPENSHGPEPLFRLCTGHTGAL